MDEWLLGMNLEKYLEPFAFSQLNDVEKILLARRGPAELEKMRRYIKDKNDLIIPNPERYSQLFDAAIMSSQLEAGNDKLGIKLGKQQAMNQFQDKLRRLTNIGSSLQQAQEDGATAITGGIGGGGFGNAAPGAVPAPPRPTGQSKSSLSSSRANTISGRKLAEKAKTELSD